MGGDLKIRQCFVGSPRLAITSAGARAKLETPSYSQPHWTWEPYRPVMTSQLLLGRGH